MKSFQDECSELAPLETFDPAAFLGDEAVPQELCNFILSLALIYNDCKDITYSSLVFSNSGLRNRHGRTVCGEPGRV